MIPNYSWKTISGWANHSGKVISQKMKETEKGYRGSKSEILQTQSPKRVSVKEQRVDGSWFLAQQARNLRCTLMGGASYYQINNPSKQFKFYYSTLNSDQNVQLNPYWLTGFSDLLLLRKSNRQKAHLLLL